MKRIITIGVVGMVIFVMIQSMGSYLVEKISKYNDRAPIIETQEEVQRTKRMVLRLETEEYYSVQVGTFSDVTLGQEIINTLAEQGYRVYVTQGPPYKLWLGCFSEKQLDASFESMLQGLGQDVHIRSHMLNIEALKFPSEDEFMENEVAPLISNYDVVLKHALKMFQEMSYSQYEQQLWIQMIAQLDSELTMVRHQCGEILASEESGDIANHLMSLEEITNQYQQSLQLILEKQNDKVVLMAQSYLLELIEQYHDFIKAASK